jgi:hypothetical protein
MWRGELSCIAVNSVFWLPAPLSQGLLSQPDSDTSNPLATSHAAPHQRPKTPRMRISRTTVAKAGSG